MNEMKWVQMMDREASTQLVPQTMTSQKMGVEEKQNR